MPPVVAAPAIAANLPLILGLTAAAALVGFLAGKMGLLTKLSGGYAAG